MTINKVLVISPRETNRKSIKDSVAMAVPAAKVVLFESWEGGLSYLESGEVEVIILDWSPSADELTINLQKLKQIPASHKAYLLGIPSELSPAVLGISSDYNLYRIVPVASMRAGLVSALAQIQDEFTKPSQLKTLTQALDQAYKEQSMMEIDKSIRELYRNFPTNIRACIEFANMCLRNEDWQAAKTIADQLTQTNPDHLRVLNLRSRLAMHEGRFDEAQGLLEQAEALSPKNLDRLVLLGDVYREKGENRQSEKFYQEALGINPEFRDAHQGLAQLSLSEGYINKALEILRDWASEREMAGFFNSAAIMAARNQEYEKAVNLYETAEQAASTNAVKSRIVFNQGLSFKKRSLMDQALECFERSFELDPAFEKAHRSIKELQNLGVKGGSIPKPIIQQPTPFQMPDPTQAPMMGNPNPGVKVQDTEKRFSGMKISVVPPKGPEKKDPTKEQSSKTNSSQPVASPSQPKFFDDPEEF